MLGIFFTDALGQFGDGPLILFGWSKVTAHHPDEVGQVLKPLARKSSVVVKARFAARLHVRKPALITATVPKVSREQPNGDSSVVGLLRYFVSKIEVIWIGRGEVARLLERHNFGARSGRVGTELVLDQVDDQR